MSRTTPRLNPRGQLERLRNFLVPMVLERFLIPVVLTLMYYLVIGPASLLSRVFVRRIFRPRFMTKESYWVRAEGYDPDRARALRQS